MQATYDIILRHPRAMRRNPVVVIYKPASGSTQSTAKDNRTFERVLWVLRIRLSKLILRQTPRANRQLDETRLW